MAVLIFGQMPGGTTIDLKRVRAGPINRDRSPKIRSTRSIKGVDKINNYRRSQGALHE